MSSEVQLQRERSSREAALGNRARAILKGDLGPILKRWVTSAVLPVSVRLSEASSAALKGDFSTVSLKLSSGVFGIPKASDSRDLKPVLEWFVKGDHAKDLVLAVLGTAISQTASYHAKDGSGVPLTRLLAACAEAARETALGQFITQVQGAEAMLKVRRKGREAWQQRKSLHNVAALLGGSVRPQLQEPGEIDQGTGKEIRLGGRQVVSILTQKGDFRRISLRTPEPGDWALLEVARKVRGEGDNNRTTWMSFAMMVLCAAQAEAGWFDTMEGAKGVDKRGRKTKQTRARKGAHQLVLSDPAWNAIKKDLDAWMGLGFIYEPMLVEPVNGDYLSVKHRQVAGGRGPMGIRTDARESAAWGAASEYLAKTPWTVPGHTLEALRNSDFVRGLALRECGFEEDPEGGQRKFDMILEAYRRVASDLFYLPVYMDFRGRVYPRTTLVTYQGNDLQKSLLVFPDEGRYREYAPSSSAIRALAMHLGNLYGHGFDKAPVHERVCLMEGLKVYAEDVRAGRWDEPGLVDHLKAAKKPLQLLTALGYLGTSHEDRIACQIDGTCNGLQHLSALFRDETAAAYVNLAPSDAPADIYGEVARRVGDKLRGGVGGGTGGLPWQQRILTAVHLDRALTKGPVMVLPYGGTRGTIDEAVREGILKQGPDPHPWTNGFYTEHNQVEGVPIVDDVYYSDWVQGNYAAFRDRPLADHPLLRLDAERLGGLVYEEIGKVIPKAMQAMETFRAIARHVGERTLEWDTTFHTTERDSLWVTQAKAVAARSTLKFKGLHLPGSIRGLSLREGRDEIDKASHVSGIVANFIHSQDASHMGRTAHYFGKYAFGANHDCFITRPSLMGSLAAATRRAFKDMYEEDPLGRSVMLYDPGKKAGVTFSSWHALAAHCGVEFPADGTWDPREVLKAQWFFS